MSIINDHFEVNHKLLDIIGPHYFTIEQVQNMIYYCLYFNRSDIFENILTLFVNLKGYPISVGRQIYDSHILNSQSEMNLDDFQSLIYTDQDMCDAIVSSNREMMSCIIRPRKIGF